MLSATACAAPRPAAESIRPDAPQPAFAGTVDIGGGRRIYIECRGAGAPTVVLLSGLDAAADLWNDADRASPRVFPAVAESNRVCAYDRPGAPTRAGAPSRSDPVPQPISPQDSVSDLHALLQAAGEFGPYVLVGHSYAGLVARLYASTYPRDVAGMVLVDSLSPELQDAMTSEEWETWKVLNARRAEDIAEYPPLERIDFDESLAQVRAAAPIRPMPMVVLSADRLYGPSLGSMIEAGEVPGGTSPEFGYVIDRTNQIAQQRVGRLVPGARHVTDTHSGHMMMIDRAPLVIDAIAEVVAAVRDGRTRILD